MKGGCVPKATASLESWCLQRFLCSITEAGSQPGGRWKLPGPGWPLTSDTLPPRWPFLPSDWSAFALFFPPPLPSSFLLVVILFKCPGPLWGNPSPLPANTLSTELAMLGPSPCSQLFFL